MVFAKVLLIIAIVIAILLALYMRWRAWHARRVRERAAWQAELERDLRRD
ncbi:hypothetical protein [Leucobacter tenebrionis]|nr:hypothetical protein [Leucobacter tenebrionis]QZY52659.1 hypothetical protein KVY00_04180 [Leucobacter tenebrionis]